MTAGPDTGYGPPPAGSATDIRDAVRTGRRTAVEICQACLDRITGEDKRWRAFTAVYPDDALAQAAAIDRERGAGRGLHRPLLGVPISIKDVICVQGKLTTAASRILDGFRPPYEATVVKRLREAGAVIVGTTNCDEFAMGSSTEHSAYGPTRNPWDADRTPGGSSGGAAAAVAARCGSAAIGSDTGGSIRQPAAFCGVVGLKPTYGRVSRYGLLAYASSLDQIGPITLTVADSALLLSVLAGPDPRDATSVDRPVEDYPAALTGRADDLRVGVPRRILEDADTGLDREVTDAFHRALETIAAAGAELVDIELPHAAYAVPAYYLVAPAEASSNLARYDGVRYGARAPVDAGDAGDAANGSEATPLSRMYDRTRDAGFGAEAKRRIMLGDVRAEPWVLRRVLPAGTAGAAADPEGLRDGVRRRQRARGRTCGSHADDADAGFPSGRAGGGSAGDVPGGCLHGERQPGGIAGDQRPRRADPRTVADRVAVDRTSVRRIDAAAAGGRLRGRAAGRPPSCTCRLKAGARSPVTHAPRLRRRLVPLFEKFRCAELIRVAAHVIGAEVLDVFVAHPIHQVADDERARADLTELGEARNHQKADEQGEDKTGRRRQADQRQHRAVGNRVRARCQGQFAFAGSSPSAGTS